MERKNVAYALGYVAAGVRDDGRVLVTSELRGQGGGLAVPIEVDGEHAFLALVDEYGNLLGGRDE